MRTTFKTLFLVTTLFSTSFGNDSDIDRGVLPTHAPATPFVVEALEEAVASPSPPTECPCKAEKRKEEAEENRNRGRRYLPWETIQDSSLDAWKEPMRAAMFAAVTDFSNIPEVITSINEAVDGIWAVVSEIQGQHPEMTLQEHYEFMTCYLGRLSQKDESDAVVASLSNLLKQHLGYSGVKNESPDIC